jgi:hypothetical protein
MTAMSSRPLPLKSPVAMAVIWLRTQLELHAGGVPNPFTWLNANIWFAVVWKPPDPLL